jgi:hypothetical protein
MNCIYDTMMGISKKFLFCFFIVLLFAFACTPIIKTLYGIKKPTVENEQSIVKYANKKGLDVERIVCFSREDWFWAIQDKKIANTIPDMIVFDKEGRLLNMRDETQCNAMNESLIASLVAGKQFEINESLLIEDIHPKLKTLNGEPMKQQFGQNPDFTIFVFWTKYTGRLNKTKTLMWQNEIQSNSNCVIDFYLVNMDQQQWWGE